MLATTWNVCQVERRMSPGSLHHSQVLTRCSIRTYHMTFKHSSLPNTTVPPVLTMFTLHPACCPFFTTLMHFFIQLLASRTLVTCLFMEYIYLCSVSCNLLSGTPLVFEIVWPTYCFHHSLGKQNHSQLHGLLSSSSLSAITGAHQVSYSYCYHHIRSRPRCQIMWWFA